MLTRMMGTDRHRRTDGQTQVKTITLRTKRPRVKNPKKCELLMSNSYKMTGNGLIIWTVSDMHMGLFNKVRLAKPALRKT